jgi:hypothetical protein
MSAHYDAACREVSELLPFDAKLRAVMTNCTHAKSIIDADA